MGDILHIIVPQIYEKYYLGCTNSKDEVIINHLRIGQKRLTHSFRMENYFTRIITSVNTLRPRQNGRHFTDDNFKHIFLNENARISIKISLKFVPRGPINNIPALVQIMAWCRPGDKPLSEPMMVRLPTHICITRPQWVKGITSWHIFIKCDFPKVIRRHYHVTDLNQLLNTVTQKNLWLCTGI